MPEALGFERLLAHVHAAPDGIEMLRRTVELHSTYSAQIDPVAEVLEAAQFRDEALGAAWRDRMEASRRVHRMIVQRITDEGQLADGWTVEDAGDLFYTVTMQAPWRELRPPAGLALRTLRAERDKAALNGLRPERRSALDFAA